MADAGPARAWEEGSVQTPKASLGKPEAGDTTQAGARTSAPFFWPLYPVSVQAGKGKRGSVFVPTKHLHPHPCANSCSAPSLPAADRPVMGMHFPQLRALVPSLSSSAWCSQVNERLHNEVITCVRMSAGLAGLQPRPAKPSHLGSPPCPLQATPTPLMRPHYPSVEPRAPVAIFSDLITNALIAKGEQGRLAKRGRWDDCGCSLSFSPACAVLYRCHGNLSL